MRTLRVFRAHTRKKHQYLALIFKQAMIETMAKLAILDLYEGTPNQGMRCIQEIAAAFAGQMDYQIFDVRSKAEVPDLSFDIYISSGGPGDPRVGDGIWDKKYYEWLQSVVDWNEHNDNKKKVFFICHSFQMAVNHFKLANITERKSMSFGTFPVHKTEAGDKDRVFEGLENPFWIADFRSYQVVEPNTKRFEAMGAEILALEKIRPHVDLERAIMAIRFTEDIVGVQFHPEADPQGMIAHFLDEKRRQAIMDEYGADKYHQMIRDLRDTDRIMRTYEAILPQFLNEAIASLRLEEALA